ncbi:hypothetical protein [Microbacterium paraoxydans]|uniref:hypothetical protein n=1 Tax=Microbacterium paraoxydans TaxID=199592 RepID=UPI003D72349A
MDGLLAVDLVEMMVAEDGERSRAGYIDWLVSHSDAAVMNMFEPLGVAAKRRDLRQIAEITGRWRADAAALGSGVI